MSTYYSVLSSQSFVGEFGGVSGSKECKTERLKTECWGKVSVGHVDGSGEDLC